MRATLAFALLLAVMPVAAERYPADSGAWAFDAQEAEVVDHLGERALRIRGGFALLPDVRLTDGLVEFDIAVPADRGFAGAAFRMQNRDNYEHFYIRPHQSRNPDANQYTPVINGISAWQLYHGEGFGAPVAYRYDEWMHVTIAFRGNQAEVFIDSEQPVLSVDALRRAVAAGGVGVGAANFAPAWFANVEVSPLPADYRFAPVERPAAATPPGTVTSWQVSAAFPAEALPERVKEETGWTVLAAEPTGITNLAGAPGVGPGQNTVVARLVLESKGRQTRALHFGYSDAVTVYLNGVPLYRGDNTYQSRDYRYLGTIGLFDTVYLPLEKGTNDLRFAVTEAFGGWGIMARFPDGDGISIRYSE